jgi:hypothetical protein
MDRFSLEILERTVELTIEAIPPEQNPRVVACIGAIQDYIGSPNLVFERNLRPALLELSEIARSNCEFLIAARLASIRRQLNEHREDSDVA